MDRRSCGTNRFTLMGALALSLAACAGVATAGTILDGPSGDSSSIDAAARVSRTYALHVLAGDGFITADQTDVNIVNAWGLAASPTGPWWVADNHTDVSTVHTADGTPLSLVVSVAAGTGIVFNSGTNFVVTDGITSGSAVFLFASESGKIFGWNPSVPLPATSTQAQVAVNSSAAGAIYKGLAVAIGTSAATDRLYATDFHNGRVDVYDGNFAPVVTAGAFVDPRIPAGYAPFGIQNIGGHIFVTYAKQDSDAVDDDHGRGRGFVSVFETDGTFIHRLVTRGRLNSPWGLALAPDGFGTFSGELLVANFGDGKINGYKLSANLKHALPRGQLRGANHKPLVIDGLWGIAFGNGATANNGPTNTLFFAAGPEDETHGDFGKIEVVPLS